MKYIDLHCDTISELLYHYQEDSLKDVNLQINLEKLKKGDSLLQCFAMFIYLKNVENPFEECIKMIDRYYQEIEKNPSLIQPVLTYSDLVENEKKKRLSALLTIEEGGVTKGNLSYLRAFYRLGVRMICLNWNFENGVGHPNFILKDHQKPDFYTPNTTTGLTDYGFSMVKEMNRLGMIVDVSHLSDKGFYDVLKTTTKPIVASHSNARSICPNVRNLTDDMIVKLAANGGVVGMNFCADFLDEKNGRNTISCVIQHMLHIKSIAGVDVIALGSDFDGIDPDIELKDSSMMPALFKAMQEAGFTEEEIEKIAYRNFLRVLKANLR